MSEFSTNGSGSSAHSGRRGGYQQRRRKNHTAHVAAAEHIAMTAANGGLRQLPVSIEAEQALLGSMLIGGRGAVEEAVTIVAAEDFGREIHGRIFAALTEVALRGDPVDIVAAKDELARRPAGPLFPEQTLLQEMGGGEERSGLYALMQLGDFVPTSANLAYYANQVRNKALLRRVIGTATDIAGLAYADPADIDGLIEEAERRIFALRTLGGIGGRNTGERNRAEAMTTKYPCVSSSANVNASSPLSLLLAFGAVSRGMDTHPLRCNGNCYGRSGDPAITRFDRRSGKIGGILACTTFRHTFMFCAFSGRPQILRLYGQGTVALPESPIWSDLHSLFPDYPGARHIIVVDVERVQTSCGFAVPLMECVGQRDTLLKWAASKGEEGMTEYRREKNAASIDGLPAPLATHAE